MDDAAFWDLIAKLDWAQAGDDQAVCRPVVEALTALPVADIQAFEEILAQKLHALDTEAHAREIGEEAFAGSRDEFSADWFLYVRCWAVANGKDMFDTVLKDPKRMPKDMEFEALLQVAAEAYEAQTGEDFDYTPSLSYETFSNQAGWQRPRDRGTTRRRSPRTAATRVAEGEDSVRIGAADSCAVVRRYDDAVMAHIAEARLRDAGIPTCVVDENQVTAVPLLAIALGGVKLLVRREDVTAAGEVLGFREDVAPPSCPSCGSTRLSRGAAGRRSAFLTILFLGIPIGRSRAKMRCEDCRYTWRQ